MKSARVLPTASTLKNGMVLVAGGYNQNSGFLSSAEVYDPSTGLWTNTGNMSTARSEHTASTLANGKVLVVGGENIVVLNSHVSYSAYFSSAEVYDPSTGLWTNTGNMSTGRYLHTASTLANGKVLVAAGYNGISGSLSSVEVYNPSTGLWTNTGNMSTARSRHTASTLANGKVLVAGGFSNVDLLSSAEVYDPSTGLWTNTGNMSTARWYHTASTLANGKVLVAGGKNIVVSSISVYDVVLNSAAMYDPSTGLWTNTGNMNTTRWDHTASTLANGTVLVVGGQNSGGVILSSVELYA
ncbi:unnamed protein product [Rotaria sp. Silwood2]|nr:unnamed protein product [Rotaria sp. Silwood2]